MRLSTLLEGLLVMIQLTLTPGQSSAGPTRVFEVIRFRFDVEKRELVMTLRDGELCSQPLGNWVMDVTQNSRAPQSCDEAERIHEDRMLIS